jgi:hypothetical protein
MSVKLSKSNRPTQAQLRRLGWALYVGYVPAGLKLGAPGTPARTWADLLEDGREA